MPQFNLNQFRSTVKSVARSQYFTVDIPRVGDLNVVTALARSTSLPAITRTAQDVAFRGLNMRITGVPEFPEWTVSYLCTEDHSARQAHIEWQELQYDTPSLTTNVHANYKDDEVKVFHLNGRHQDVFSYRFFGMFPTQVGEMQVAQEGGDLMTFDVTYSYDYFLQGVGSAANGFKGVNEDNQGLLGRIGDAAEKVKGIVDKVQDLKNLF